MLDISTGTLMLAISAIAERRSSLLDRIADASSEVDEDQHLSEQVMDIDRALGELAGPYEAQRQADRIYPEYEALIASFDK